jgi:hypothetical protein
LNKIETFLEYYSTFEEAQINEVIDEINFMTQKIISLLKIDLYLDCVK